MSAILLGGPPGRIHLYSIDGVIAQSALGTLVWEVISKTDLEKPYKKFYFISL